MTPEIQNLKAALLEEAEKLAGVTKLLAKQKIATYCELLDAVHRLSVGAIQSYSVAGSTFSKVDLNTLHRLSVRYREEIDALLGFDSPTLFASDSLEG